MSEKKKMSVNDVSYHSKKQSKQSYNIIEDSEQGKRTQKMPHSPISSNLFLGDKMNPNYEELLDMY